MAQATEIPAHIAASADIPALVLYVRQLTVLVAQQSQQIAALADLIATQNKQIADLLTARQPAAH